jgi:F-type H+-transporting ATPase subunit gamma
MPGGQERALRRRIGSTQNIKKITRAMELISATRVVKAQQAANDARPYSEHITQVITDLASGGVAVDHPLLRAPEEVRVVGIVVLSSDRGMAGAYNAGVIRAAEREIQAARSEGREYRLVTVGRKSAGYFRFRGYEIEAAFDGMTDKPTYEDARAIAQKVVELFMGDVDQIDLVYTQFVSMGTQRVTVRRFLPLETESEDEAADATPEGPTAQFEFEPSPAAVLESLLPRYVESRLFSALLDAAASEHASRQRAMKSATDNAEDLILKLTRRMNQARQDAITTEIMEIIGGAEALSADKSEDPEELLLDHLSSDPFPPLVSPHQFAHSPES